MSWFTRKNVSYLNLQLIKTRTNTIYALMRREDYINTRTK